MSEYNLDYTAEDIGEIVLIVRAKKYGLSIEAFADRLKVSAATINQVEEGRGGHGFQILKKMLDMKMISEATLTIKT